MKKKKLFLAAFLGCSIYAVSLSSNVEAQELTPQNEVSVQVYAPSKNGLYISMYLMCIDTVLGGVEMFGH